VTARRPVGRTALTLVLVLVAAACDRFGSKDKVIALEGATLIDGAGGEPRATR